ncbi:MAG: zinc ribbon domain-containing protein [Lachnospiraceae bacterium]|nr:zinc ribbon domain-containing protein [Lachnospiraceae bacterium]
MYACPNCGGNIKFDPATQMMKCSYCGTMISPHDKMYAHGADEEKGIDTEADDEYEVTYYTCPQCGGELITDDNTAATFCSYCGSSTILEMRVGKEKKPDYIIPFKKTREDCVKEYKKVLRRAIFAPNELRKDETVDRFRGIYMPYWIYGVKKKGDFSVNGITSKRRGDYIYKSHYTMTTNVDVDYSGISYDASSSFEDRLSEAIAPFDLNESDHFTSAYFSGFYADTSDVSAKLYDDDAKNATMSDAAAIICKDNTYSKHGASTADVVRGLESRGTDVSHKMGMFPVWFLSNQTGDRVSYAVVNGQTGKVAMDMPIDIKKYFLGCLIIALPLCALLLFSRILIGPKILIGLTMVISLIVLILANKQANTLFAREILFDDKGYNSKKTTAQIRETQELLKGNVKIKKAKITPQNGGKGVTAAFAYAGIGLALGSIVGMGPLIAVIVLVVMLIYNAATKNIVPKDRVIVKAPFSKKVGLTIFPLITIIAGALVFMINPFQDSIYYGTAILGMVMTGYTVIRLVARHNMLSSRKLPQFNKRGGEEHENED